MKYKGSFIAVLLVLLMALVGCSNDNDPVAPTDASASRAPGQDLYITATADVVTVEWKVEGYYDAYTRSNSEWGDIIGRIVYSHHHFWEYDPNRVAAHDFGHSCCNDILAFNVVDDEFWLTLTFPNPADEQRHQWVLIRMWGTVDEPYPEEGHEKWAWPPENAIYTRPDNRGDRAISFVVSYDGTVIPVPAAIPADIYRPCD